MGPLRIRHADGTATGAGELFARLTATAVLNPGLSDVALRLLAVIELDCVQTNRAGSYLTDAALGQRLGRSWRTAARALAELAAAGLVTRDRDRRISNAPRVLIPTQTFRPARASNLPRMADRPATDGRPRRHPRQTALPLTAGAISSKERDKKPRTSGTADGLSSTGGETPPAEATPEETAAAVAALRALHPEINGAWKGPRAIHHDAPGGQAGNTAPEGKSNNPRTKRKPGYRTDG